jgi:predicted ABC-type ATPase
MNIYIIAGPPGIGKSTRGLKFIPKDIEIIDHDLAAYQYKKEGFADYKELGIMSGNQQIRSNLFAKESFALELNLGFQSHYDYLKSMANFDPTNKIHLILFFTDSLDLCLTRASIRYESGGHLVKPEIVTEMYDSTIPLLKENVYLFKSMSFINNTNTIVRKVKINNPPNWVKDNDLIKYL